VLSGTFSKLFCFSSTTKIIVKEFQIVLDEPSS